MRLYRFTDETCEKLEEVTFDQLDLMQKTLFIFPGMEVEKPLREGDMLPRRFYEAYGRSLPTEERRGRIGYVSPKMANPTLEEKRALERRIKSGFEVSEDAIAAREKHLMHLLERGVVLGQEHGLDIGQVVVASYDDWDENLKDINKLMHDPKFIGREAEKFINELYNKKHGQDSCGERREIDPSKITLMGWSYGTVFIQQCANQLSSEAKEDIQKIHAICVASIINIEWLMETGFPGLYMYGLNDTTLPKYIPSYKGDLIYLVKMMQSQEVSKDEVPVLVPKGRTDQVITISNMPDTVHRFRKLPRGKSRDGKPYIDDPCHLNPKRHAAGAFMEAFKGSTFTEPDSGEVIEAYRHTPLFRIASSAILGRDGKRVSKKAMLNVPRLTDKEAEDVWKDMGWHVSDLHPPQYVTIGEIKAMEQHLGVKLFRDLPEGKDDRVTNWRTFVIDRRESTNPELE